MENFDFKKRILTSQLPSYIGKEVVLFGWVHKIRSLGGINFIILRDKDGIVQVVAETFLKEKLKNLTTESVVGILGRVKKEKKAPFGLEVKARKIIIISSAQENLPIEINKKEISANLDVILDHRALSLRNLKLKAIFKIQQEIASLFREFFKSKGFVEIFPPEIVFKGAEGGAELFKVSYYKKKAYLAQSPQFYKQIMVGVFERVFSITNAFRAELHDTSRHLSEYVSLDIEMGFIRNEKDLIAIHSEFLEFLLRKLKERCGDLLNQFSFALPEFKKDIPLVSLKEAQEILEKEYQRKSKGKADLDPEEEKLLCDYFRKKGKGDFVFVIGWPAVKRPMYTMPDSRNPSLTLSFDLLCRGREITTGGQRIHNLKMQIKKIKEKRLLPSDFEFYLEIFKYGMPPHGGFAIGLERATMQFLELKNIREASLFPRDIKRLIP